MGYPITMSLINELTLLTDETELTRDARHTNRRLDQMPRSLDGIVSAVVERIMAQAQRKYPQHRRPPRAYIKRLKDTSRTVPVVALPTGPLPDEPWFEPEEDEAEVPLIGEAILTYEKEHSHRAKMTRYQSERAISMFLTNARLHENEPIWTINR